jgi:hypothetical protein
MDGTSSEGNQLTSQAAMSVAQTAPPPVPPTPRSLLAIGLAGLQAGMLGAIWMLAWLGLSAAWQRDSFWKPENLFATAFYGNAAYQGGFVHSTFSGLSLYLLLYSLLGALFAVSVRERLRPSWTLFAAVALGIVWYYLTFRLLWRSAIPMAFLWHAETPTLLGHMLYGTFLGRFPVYLHQPRPVVTPAPVVEAAPLELPVAVPVLEDVETNPADTTPDPDRSSSPPDQA